MKKFDVELLLTSSYGPKLGKRSIRVTVYGVIAETKKKAERIAKRSVELDATAYVVDIKESSNVG